MAAAAAVCKYWVSTVSKEHVMIGVEGGFCQVCHGKRTPLARMHKGDWLVYYSPKDSLGGKIPCQSFTAIGQIADENIYAFKMSEDFVPFRRDVEYLKDTKEAPIHPLLEKLSFTKGQKSWGMVFRSGIFEITRDDFKLIYDQMVSDKTKAKK